MAHQGIDPDRIAPTSVQVTPALHMLAISIPLMSALYGACLRQALSYHQLFHRLDPFLFRLLVGILLVLVTGQVACITAETWYILTTVINAKEDLQTQRIINACTQTATTATALLCQGFYTERLFAALALASSWVSICLIRYAHQRRSRSLKSTPILPLSSRLFQLVSLSIQTFFLLTLNQIASAIGFTSSLSTSSNATAACIAFFFFNLFPGLSVFSIIYTLNQRSLELVKKKKYATRSRGTRNHRRKERRIEPSSSEEKQKRKEVMREEEEIGTGMTAPEDDPSNWRGDHLATGSRTGSVGVGVGVGGAGLGVFDPVAGWSACGFSSALSGFKRVAVGSQDGDMIEKEKTDLENGLPTFLAPRSTPISTSSTSIPPPPPPRPIISNHLDDFDPSYSSSDSDSESEPELALSSSSLPPQSRPREDSDIFHHNTFGSAIPSPPPPARLEIDEIGQGLNWDALEGCQEARIGPDMSSRRGSRV
ncbi:hypothetical protein JCM5353_006813 [Sporobolomyces roseus]